MRTRWSGRHFQPASTDFSPTLGIRHARFAAAAAVTSVLVSIGGAGFLVNRSMATAAPHDVRPVVTVAAPSRHKPGGLLARTTPLLGVIGASGRYLAVEREAQVGSVTIVMTWRGAEPKEDSASVAYLTSINKRIEAARAAGFTVVVDPGLQYPPAWVFSLPGGVRFVDQYGDHFSGPIASGNDVVNGVTDLAVRDAMQGYLAYLGSHLLLADVKAIRQGGGPFDELRYPGPDYNGHSNCYWAYDKSSRALSPALAYVPGTSTPAQAEAFLMRYNADLISFADWMNAQYERDFHKDVLLLLPGWGERPGVNTIEEQHLLEVPYAEFNEGLDWPGLLHTLPDRSRTIAYTTYLDAPSYSPTPQLEDPADYLSSLALPLGMDLGGENTGIETLSAMQDTLGRARALHLKIVNWFDESELVAASEDPSSGAPTFADLAAIAKADL